MICNDEGTSFGLLQNTIVYNYDIGGNTVIISSINDSELTVKLMNVASDCLLYCAFYEGNKMVGIQGYNVTPETNSIDIPVPSGETVPVPKIFLLNTLNDLKPLHKVVSIK